MRLEINCSKCLEQITPGETRVVYSHVRSVCDNGIYEFECPQGHHTTTVLRTPKHEVLFTIGVNAFLDGYFRDAIASFASALERYYEFALRVIARYKKISPETFMKTWNFMLKQSERQYGAFIAVWMMERGGDPYTQLSKNEIEKLSKLRNGVIHNGDIPPPEECLKYGQYVLDIIEPVEKVLHADYAAAHKDECFANYKKEASKQQSSEITALSIISALDVALKSGDKKIESAIARLKEVRKYKDIPSIRVDTLKSQTVTYPRKS